MNINGASQVYGRYSIKDLVDIDKLSQIFARFSLITGFTTTLAVYPTQEILIATGWRDVCTKFHRAFPKSLQRCRESNSSLSRQLSELKQVNISRCKNGLIDGATPIFIRGEYLAFIATGQVFFEEPDIEWFKRQAAVNGYDLERYLEDVRQVPVVSEAQFTEVLSFLSDLAVGVADQGLRNMELEESYAELEEEIASRKSIEQASRQAEEKYRSIFENEVEGILQSTPDGRYIAANPAMARMFGYASPEELLAHISDIKGGWTNSQGATMEYSSLP
jgi:PAS domain-containing protein